MDRSVFKEIEINDGSSKLSDYTVEEVLCSYRNIPISSVIGGTFVNFLSPWHYYSHKDEFYNAIKESELLKVRLESLKLSCIMDYAYIKKLVEYFGSLKVIRDNLWDDYILSNNDIEIESMSLSFTSMFLEFIAKYYNTKYYIDICNEVKNFDDDIMPNIAPSLLNKGDVLLINNPFIDSDDMPIKSKSLVVSNQNNIPEIVLNSGEIAPLWGLVVPIIDIFDVIDSLEVKNLDDLYNETIKVIEEIGEWKADI